MRHPEHDPLPWVNRTSNERAKDWADDHDLAPRAEYCQTRQDYLPEWINVKLAARVAGRAPRTIYEWIEDDRLAARQNGEGILEVLSKAAFRLGGTVRRGRPRGIPTRR